MFHYGHAVKQLSYLLEVERLATEQLGFIDKEAPTDQLSSQSSAERSGVNVYLALAKQAATIAKLLSGVPFTT